MKKDKEKNKKTKKELEISLEEDLDMINHKLDLIMNKISALESVYQAAINFFEKKSNP